MASSEQFDWSDAWVLTAILTGGRDLRGIIATGDMLNHAILTLRELNQALERLSHCGLVERHGDEFHPTVAASAIYNRPKVRKAGMFKQIDEILEELRCRNEVAAQAATFVPISQSAYETAVRAYSTPAG